MVSNDYLSKASSFVWERVMFHKLKQCKTLKEIYEVLGLKPFEICAAFIMGVWILLPIWAAIEQLNVGLHEDLRFAQGYLVMHNYQYNVQSIGLLTLGFTIFFLVGRMILNKGQIRNKIKSEPWHFFLLLMLLWACISTGLSDDPRTSFFGTEYRFDGLEMYFFYAAVYVCAFIVVKSSYRRKLLCLFSMAANVVSVFVIIQDAGSELLNQCFLGIRAAMFFQFNHTGYYLNMAILCSMGLYLYENSRKWRALYLVSMILQVYAILVNSTFGSFIGTWCALVMILIFFVRSQGKFAWRMLTPVLVVVFLCIASYFGYVPTSSGQDMKVNMETLFGDMLNIWEGSEKADAAGHGRVMLWKQGLKMIPKRPVFGYGPEQLDEELSEIMWVDRPDNEFIQHAVFLGVPGLAYYLTALIWLFIHQWLKMKRLDATTLVAAGCVIAYLVSAMFGNTMFYTTPYFYMFLAFAAGRVKNSS